ncbi:MAG: DMT family transporter [Hyphomicrobiales bacterium]|nr:DMT family transporter [Hyphomicrobiales bacterium]
MPKSTPLTTVAPFLFVAIWSTGWIMGRYAAMDGDPLTFLLVRFASAIAVLTPITIAIRADWPKGGRAIAHALGSGVLLHALYLGGVWWAIAHGVPAGLSAVIAALQPLMTAALAPVLAGETIRLRRAGGFVVGFLGIAIVVSPKLVGLAPGDLGAVALPLAVNVAAMLAVTLGTFHQKARVASGHLLAVATLQYVGALLVLAPIAFLIEPMRFDLNARSAATLAWSVLGLSIGAIGLLLHLIRCGEVSRAAALIYLVPPAAVAEAWFLFGETVSPIQIFGVAVTVSGVVLAQRRG